MKVLFLGNSFTYFNDLPGMVQRLAEKTGVPLETDSVTRGGAYLHQFADPADALYDSWQEKYRQEIWDYVIFQDQSFHPVRDPEGLRQAALAVKALCRPEQKFLFYQTWAYKDGTDKLAGTALTYAEMLTKMIASYGSAAKAAEGGTVPVGRAFAEIYAIHPEIELYNPDAYHPSPAGTYLAACLFYAVITGRSPMYLPVPGEVDTETGGILRSIADWLITREILLV